MPGQSIFDDLPRGIPDNAAITDPPDACFAGEKTILQPGFRFNGENRDGKIFLGLYGADIQKPSFGVAGQVRHPYATGGNPIGIADDMHIITVAGSRAGKGRGALVPNLLTYPGSVLVIDPKGDIASITARYRAESLGQSVYVLDPFRKARNYAAQCLSTYNPLSFLDPYSGTIIEDAGLIADALVVPSQQGDPHWDQTARNLIEGIILHVASSPDYRETRDLATVRDLLMRAMQKTDEDSPFEYALQDEMMCNAACGGAVIEAATEFYDKADRERDSVLSTARRHLRFLGYEQIRGAVRDSPLDLRDLKRKPVTIYLSLPALRMGTCSGWLRLFVNLTLAAMEEEQTKPPHPVLLCLDEFAVLGHMKTIEDAAGQIAGLGCKLWPVLQDLGQLKALYKDRWETFLGNAGVLQFFGNSDLTTLEWISKRLGQTTIKSESKSSPTYEAAVHSGATGASWSDTTHPLMTTDEVARFFGRDDPCLRQLILRPSQAMILQRAFYDKHELFRGRYE